MTRDDIVKWAHEAAIIPPGWGATENQWKSLHNFAVLVIGNHQPRSSMAWQEGYEIGVATERKACAKICGKIADSVSYEMSKSALKCYEAIRARGLTSLQRQLIDAEKLQSDPAELKAREGVWVGLTVEEIEAIGKIYAEKDGSIQMWGLYAVAIETKLKEKNT
jgi:hypothetical protein